MEQQLALIDRAFAEPLDLTTQLTRLPPIDAPCVCRREPDDCEAPYCPWQPTDEGEE